MKKRFQGPLRTALPLCIWTRRCLCSVQEHTCSDQSPSPINRKHQCSLWSVVISTESGLQGSPAPQEIRTDCFWGGGSDQDELLWPAHFTVLEITPRDQGSELSSAMMIPRWLWERI